MPASAAIPCLPPARPSGALLRHRLLKGVPAVGDGAQLLNAACQVAYGSGG
ncbi:MAG: hypothetical protein ACKOE9_06975 [Vulcanococcus sp.]